MNKICTDIRQSKKLIELGIDVSTSDCSWILHPVDGHYILSLTEPLEDDIPCWSLSALLSVLPYPDIKQRYDGKWICRVENKDTTYLWVDDSPIDACVAMIEKLHEQKLL